RASEPSSRGGHLLGLDGPGCAPCSGRRIRGTRHRRIPVAVCFPGSRTGLQASVWRVVCSSCAGFLGHGVERAGRSLLFILGRLNGYGKGGVEQGRAVFGEDMHGLLVWSGLKQAKVTGFHILPTAAFLPCLGSKVSQGANFIAP